MNIYVIIESKSKRFVDASPSVDYAKRLVTRLNDFKCLVKDGSHYEFIELIDII